MAQKKDVLEFVGLVVETLPGTQFIIELENGHRIMAHIAGRMRKNYIKIIPGDRVKVEINPEADRLFTVAVARAQGRDLPRLFERELVYRLGRRG